MNNNNKVLCASVGVVAIGIGAIVVFGSHGLPISVGVAVAVMLLASLKLVAKLKILEELVRVERNQIEAMVSLVGALQPVVPLPQTGGWAASPDFLRETANSVLARKPTQVVEASSGLSTLIIAYCLKRNGFGRVVSLENDPKYAEKTRQLLELHGLSDFGRVIDGPNTPVKIGEKQWKWYDLAELKLDHPIDLLVIDGPQYSLQDFARYPALPLLHERFGAETMILLDDGAREDVCRVVSMWKSEFDDVEESYLELEKGAYSLIVRKDS